MPNILHNAWTVISPPFSRVPTIKPNVSLNELKRKLKDNAQVKRYDPSSRDSSRMQAPFYKDT